MSQPKAIGKLCLMKPLQCAGEEQAIEIGCGAHSTVNVSKNVKRASGGGGVGMTVRNPKWQTVTSIYQTASGKILGF